MARNQLVLIHGYSDEGSSFEGWRKALAARGYDVTALSACNYKTLTNEVTIKDIAEGFDRALSLRVGLGPDEPFEAIVHSTGMLVIRAWLTTYERRRGRLKRLIGLAPASFGSPLAHKGRSWLGSVFKGNKEYGPDFLEAGDLVLDGLELGSRYTWDLAHRDLLGEKAFYGSTDETPYVFVFCGNRAYGGFSLRRLVNEPGTDGTVRWAGCALDTRKITLDLTVDPARDPELSRFRFAPWSNVRIPLHLVDGLNHGTILTTPSEELIDIVDRALQVDSEDKLAEVQAAATAMHERAKAALGQDGGFAEWQQFVIRVTDERGDPVPDYNIQLVTYVDSRLSVLSRLICPSTGPVLHGRVATGCDLSIDAGECSSGMQE